MNENLILIKILTLLAVTLSVSVGDINGLEEKCQTIVLANGRSRFQRRGRLVRFRCFKGFEFVGRRYMNCFKGRWDYQRDPSVNYPMCVKPGCHASPFVNGHFLETYKGAVVNVVCNLGYTLIGSSTVYCNGLTWNRPFPQCQAINRTPPKICDFEKGLCGWSQDPYGDWLWQNGTRDASAAAEPPYEESNPGRYIFLGNSSSRIANATERLFSPVFPPEYSNGSCFMFWYRLHGPTTGHLKIYVKPEGSDFYTMIPPFWVTGEQGPSWKPGFFRIDPMTVPFQIVIEGMSLPGGRSDTSFDDVKIGSGEECANFWDEQMTTTFTPFTGIYTTEDQSEDEDNTLSCKNRCNLDATIPETNLTAFNLSEVPSCDCHRSCILKHSCCSDFYQFCSGYALVETTENIPETTEATRTNATEETSDEVVRTTNDETIGNASVEMNQSKSSVFAATRGSETSTRKPYRDFSRDRYLQKIFKIKKVESNLSNSKVTVAATTPKTNRVNLPLLISPSRFFRPSKLRNNGKTPKEVIHRAGNDSPQPMKSDDPSLQHSEGLPAGTIEAIVGVIALFVCATVAVLFVLRRRRRKTAMESMVEDSDVRFLTSDEFLDFTLARPADDDL